MEFLYEVSVFSLKALVILVSVALVLLLFFSLVARSKNMISHLEVEDLNQKWDNHRYQILQAWADAKYLKSEAKALKKKSKAQSDKHRIFVLDFDGDIKASAVETFRDLISAVMMVAKPEKDEVVLRITSPGGLVHTYGLAAAQILRLRSGGIRTTACIDKVAASGGYLMAAAAENIIAAPFAIIGSIGVIAQIPNFHKLLKKNDIDYEELTAGQYKRTVSLFGEITDQGKRKFISQIEDTHALFKEFLATHRSKVAVEEVSTGEYWYGQRALGLGLIDQIATSEAYLMDKANTHQILKISLTAKKKLADRIQEMVGSLQNHLVTKAYEKFYQMEWPQFK